MLDSHWSIFYMQFFLVRFCGDEHMGRNRKGSYSCILVVVAFVQVWIELCLLQMKADIQCILLFALEMILNDVFKE